MTFLSHSKRSVENIILNYNFADEYMNFAFGKKYTIIVLLFGQ